MRYIDTNIIIYAIEKHPKYGQNCRIILEDILKGILDAWCSELILVEVLSVLTKLNEPLRKKIDIRKNIDALLSLPINWIELNHSIIRRAAEYKLKVNTVDYVHIASMELMSIKTILSADRDLDKVKIIKRIDPLDY